MKIITNFPTGWIKRPNFYSINEVKKISSDDIIYFYDVFDENWLYDIIDRKGTPKYIVNDSLNFIEMQRSLPVYCINLWLENTAHDLFNLIPSNELTTTHSVNFVINKKQINRYLAIKLVELFNLKVDYTWSGIGASFDCSEILRELTLLDSTSWLTASDRSFLLSPIAMKKKWIPWNEDPENSINEEVNIKDFGEVVETWNNGINQIVSNSGVSLITESVREHRGIHFSEKTLYSVLGLTFPIWVGGYKQAEYWEKCGLDTFNDVINHSYQYRETLIERCWFALHDNLKLLQNQDLLAKLRITHQDRLHKNLEFILSNGLRQHNLEQFCSFPLDLQHLINEEILPQFFKKILPYDAKINK